MPSSIFLLLTSFSFLLTLDLCSASPQNPGPTGPSSPTGPGFDCTFQPVSGFGPDTTTPRYNAGLVSQDSVSNYIQCAGEASNLQLTEDNQRPVNALDILVSATKTCGQYKLSKVIQDYVKTDQSVKLTHYLCGKANNSDLCALSRCIGAKKREHSLKGVCQNSNVNLWDNPETCITDDGDAGGDDSTTITDDDTDSTTAASSSTTVADASNSTATASTSSSSDTATTTSPAQTPSNTAAANPSPSSNAASRMHTAGLGELTATGVLLIVLVALSKC